MDVNDIPRVVREAFFLASSGRPGPVLIDIPKDVQQQMAVPDWNPRLGLTGYLSRLPGLPQAGALAAVLARLRDAKAREHRILPVVCVHALIHPCPTHQRPVVYAGGGCLAAAPELAEFVRRTGVPVAQTLMGLGVFPESSPLALGMLGMHGTVYANYAIDQADLLLAFGVRFDDRVTGKLETFAQHAAIVHIDVDPAEIGKNKTAHVALCADIKPALAGLNAALAAAPPLPDYGPWRAELAAKRAAHPMAYPASDTYIVPQAAIALVHEMTGGGAIVSTGVGQHQMWAAQWYPFDQPFRWLTSGGLGAMGFGLPSALGAAAAHPHGCVVNIDGDGSFLMNIQELATCRVDGLAVKTVILNNQHLGMVVQWEDRFYKANRAHTYLGRPDADYAASGDEGHIYPDFVAIAKGFGVPAARVTRVAQLREAIATMLATPGPYLLDVMVPHQEHGAQPQREAAARSSIQYAPLAHCAPHASATHDPGRRLVQGHHRARRRPREPGHGQAVVLVCARIGAPRRKAPAQKARRGVPRALGVGPAQPPAQATLALALHDRWREGRDVDLRVRRLSSAFRNLYHQSTTTRAQVPVWN